MTIDYKDTLNLPKTEFPMRGNLAKREPEMIQKWEKMDVYGKGVAQRKAVNAPRYTLHDGPPYANGNIHHGHILNKVLKDFVVKYHNMKGELCEFIPGWDCHGLPIEHQVDKKLGKAKREMSKVEIRQTCREYAKEFVEIQADEFKRVMVFADWEKKYRTMDYGYESATVRTLGGFMEKGLVYQGLKPVHWDWASRTALAEAEVEYAAHTTEHVYVKFAFPDLPGEMLGYTAGLDPFLVIWTTTPWTLPANLAIALHPDLDYQLVQNGHDVYVIAEALRESFETACKLENTAVLHTFKGSELVGELGEGKGLKARHPFIDRDSILLPADYVTIDQGTGCVHTAPGHGQEDFVLGQQYGLEVLCPVDFRGCFIEELVPDWPGEHVFKANPKIVEKLDAIGALVNAVGDKVTIDRYPHGWRSKKPVIFRATTQWFIAMEKESAGEDCNYSLRASARAEIDKVKWVPDWGKARIIGMVENRPDWCISRQRTWGCPITVMHCSSCNKAIVDSEITYHVADLIKDAGADVWFDKDPSELVPAGYTCPHCSASPDRFEKEQDILDVWFDSGTSWAAVLEDKLGWDGVADLYLEGSDQHRGWFQSSLMCSMGIHDRSPYKTCLTHGFVMDKSGKKYSKSSKNFTSPQRMIDQGGAELLRLWVCSVDYQNDMTLSPEVMKGVTDAYRKIRNTMRFLLGNLEGFNPKTDLVPIKEMEELDQWLLDRASVALEKVQNAYENFHFHQIFHTFVQLCTIELSNVHMDISKDHLYCEASNGKKRRSTQSAYYMILDNLLRAMAPVLSFTCEEAWGFLPGANDKFTSVHLADFPSDYTSWRSQYLEERWERLLEIRSDVQKALEEVRVPKKEKKPGQIGSSQEAHIVIQASGDTLNLLRDFEEALPQLFIVSSVEVEKGEVPPNAVVGVHVLAADGKRCERCWNYWITSESASKLCDRCASVVES